MKKLILGASFFSILCSNVAAETPELAELMRKLEILSQQSAAQNKQIRELQDTIESLRTTPRPSSVTESPTKESSSTTNKDLWSKNLGGANLRLIDLSLVGILGAGWSSANDEELENLQAGGHDPNKRGFTLQQVELSLTGAIDPHLNGEAHLIYFIDAEGESQFEVEEAFVTTQALPADLQLEVGQFFTEFGIINPSHPHTWQFVDQPIINSRLFGADGMRAPGFRLGWLTPLPWFAELHLGMQNSNGETMRSFRGEDGVGGRPNVERATDGLDDFTYLARLENSWELSDEITTKLGFSGLHGPNSSGTSAHSWIYGADMKLSWRPLINTRGWPFVTWQSEFMQRDYDAASFTGKIEAETARLAQVAHGAEEEHSTEGEAIEVSYPSDTLKDSGFYTQLLYGFDPGWAAGMRFEYASGSGESIEGSSSDPFRDNRYRLSPLIAYHPSEYSRVRLQYNYDNAEHLTDDSEHSFWLVLEWLYGAHPAHKY